VQSFRHSFFLKAASWLASSTNFGLLQNSKIGTPRLFSDFHKTPLRLPSLVCLNLPCHRPPLPRGHRQRVHPPDHAHRCVRWLSVNISVSKVCKREVNEASRLHVVEPRMNKGVRRCRELLEPLIVMRAMATKGLI